MRKTKRISAFYFALKHWKEVAQWHEINTETEEVADEYIRTGNVTQSAIEAGYKQAHVQGSQNLEKLSVKEYIAIRLKQVETTTQMSQTEALELLAKFARGDVKETVVVGTTMGAETVEKELDHKTQLNAIKEVLRFSKFSNDITEQQVRKAKADADMAEAKVKLLDGNNGEIQPEG